MVRWLSSKEASTFLGVSATTLYAYVSRGLVRSSASPGKSHLRRYAAEDLERLRGRRELRRDPAKTAERALHWGMPVLESAITLIDSDRLYYRGHDACELAQKRSVEEVAALLWTGDFAVDLFANTPLHVVAGGESAEALPFISRAQSMLPLVAVHDSLAFDLRSRAVAQTGWRIVNLLTSVAVESSDLEETIEETLCKRWIPRTAHATEILRAALILCADHELNVSSFTARCVASAKSNPYAVVVAGLAAIEGAKHGGMSEKVETMLDELRRTRDVRKALADRLRRGEPIYGFGHPLYANGDPRAALLMEMLGRRFAKSAELTFARSVAKAGEELTGDKPTIDFALVAVARTLKLPRGAALTLFALGRSIGWIGHAIEQYANDEMIRPRAKYIGEGPKGSG
ncbi:MAG: citrate synthase [Thermoanaerobaculia bacterium]|jgi:citrate synthase|nr:citrate synthase [Thermoanaerobaculia bacterium]